MLVSPNSEIYERGRGQSWRRAGIRAGLSCLTSAKEKVDAVGTWGHEWRPHMPTPWTIRIRYHVLMIRVLVSYPNKPGARFDESYYLNQHMPMVAKKLEPHGMNGWSVDRGLSGMMPGTPADHAIQAHLIFDTLEGYKAGLAAEGASILADIPNYTDIQPQIQINEILR